MYKRQGKTYPLCYVKNYGKGKVFYSGLGHDMRSFNNPEFQKILKRGLSWITGKEERKKEVGCGIVGYGPYFNMGKYHADLVNLTEGLKLKAICDKNEERVKVAKSDFPEVRVYKNIKEFLKDSEVELVIIVTPHNTHKDLSILSLKADKNVLMLKCLVVDLENQKNGGGQKRIFLEEDFMIGEPIIYIGLLN